MSERESDEIGFFVEIGGNRDLIGEFGCWITDKYQDKSTEGLREAFEGIRDRVKLNWMKGINEKKGRMEYDRMW